MDMINIMIRRKKQRTEKKEARSMNTINVKKFGLAVGATFALLYFVCILIVMSIGREGVIFLVNTLFHGIDVTSLIRTAMPLSNMLIGLVEIFIIGWLMGATIASIYN